MDISTIKQQAIKFEKARSNLLTVIAFTVINLLLRAFNSDFYFLFSLTVPQCTFEVCRDLAEELQNNAFIITGLAIVFVVILSYFLCWFFAKRIRAFILVAFILFSIDSLVFVIIILTTKFDASYLIDIAFQGVILFYLFNGVIAWIKLRGVNHDDFNAALQEVVVTPSAIQSNDENLDDQTTTDEL